MLLTLRRKEGILLTFLPRKGPELGLKNWMQGLNYCPNIFLSSLLVSTFIWILVSFSTATYIMNLSPHSRGYMFQQLGGYILIALQKEEGKLSTNLTQVDKCSGKIMLVLAWITCLLCHYRQKLWVFCWFQLWPSVYPCCQWGEFSPE